MLKHIRKGSIGEAYQYWRGTMRGKTFIEDAVSKIEQGLLDPHMTEIRLGVPLTFDPTDIQFMGENE